MRGKPAIQINELLAIWARKGAALGDCGKMCSECAFRLNTVANLDAENIDIAAQCVAFRGTFCCHKIDNPETMKPCAGFLYAKQYANTMGQNRFYFVAISKAEFEQEDGAPNSKAVQADIRLELSPNLSKQNYHNPDGSPTKEAIKPTTIALTSGLVANIKYAAEKGWWNENEHIDYIIEQLQRMRGAAGNSHITEMEY